MPDRYAVFGNPVAHSKSPQIHRLFAQQAGQDMSYEAILAPLDGFEYSVRGFTAGGGRGANVTVPFKENAYRLSTKRTARAEAAGAVNTLIFSGDTITGDNTDGAGLVCDIQSNIGVSISKKRVLLLGAGGAARGVVLPLLHESPVALVIANRSEDKARQLADQFSNDPFSLSRSSPALSDEQGGQSVQDSTGSPRAAMACAFHELAGQSFDLIINATSVGLNNIELPLPDSIFAPGCLAYEMVYGGETPFMRQARKAGAHVADGLGMLVEQAAAAFYVWRGVMPDTAPVLKQLRQLRSK